MKSPASLMLGYFLAKEKFSISSETSVYLVDETGTEVDEEVFSDVLEEKSEIIWNIVDASTVNGKEYFALLHL